MITLCQKKPTLFQLEPYTQMYNTSTRCREPRKHFNWTQRDVRNRRVEVTLQNQNIHPPSLTSSCTYATQRQNTNATINAEDVFGASAIVSETSSRVKRVVTQLTVRSSDVTPTCPSRRRTLYAVHCTGISSGFVLGAFFCRDPKITHQNKSEPQVILKEVGDRPTIREAIFSIYSVKLTICF